MFFDSVGKLLEEVRGIVRTGGSFRVVLDAEDRERFVSETRNGIIVEVDVGDFQIIGKGIRIDGEAVVLGGDGDGFGLEVLDRVVCAAVTEFEFESFAAECAGDDLVAKADAEDRDFADEVADGAVGVVQGSRVTGAVREKNAIGFEGEDICGRGGGGEGGHRKTVLAQEAEDIVFGTEVQSYDMVRDRRKRAELVADFIRFRRGRCFIFRSRLAQERPFPACGLGGIPLRGRGRGYFPDKIHAFHARRLSCEADGFCIREGFCGEASAQGATGAEVFGEGAGIDATDAGNAFLGKVGIEVEGGAPVADDGAEFCDDEAAEVRGGAFFVDRVHPIVTDFRIGHGDNLTAVGGVGKDFLIPGHGSVEANFSGSGAASSEGDALE